MQGFKDLQTEADRSAQSCIVASLQKQYPLAAVIGEEVGKQSVKIKASYSVLHNS